MRQIITLKNQTIFDLAVQEYGTIEAAFQILADNPHLAGLNYEPITEPGADFSVSASIIEGVTINLQDSIEIENIAVAKQLENVIS